MTAQDLYEKFRELVQEAQDDGWTATTAADGSLTLERTTEVPEGDPTPAPERVVFSLAGVNAPSYEDLTTIPTDRKTASESPPLTGVPEEVGDLNQEGATTPTDDDVNSTDAAQEKADELGVDLSTVDGTGKDGRVLVEDVEKAAE